MRRLLSVLVVGFVMACAVGPAVSAAPPERQTIGRFVGQTVVDFETQRCSFVYQTFSATYRDASGDTGRFRLAGCVEIGTGFTYSGTLLLTPPGGVQVTGTVAGTVYGTTPPFPCAAPSGGPASLQFTLTPDTGAVITLLGTWCPGETQRDPILGVLSS